MLVVKKFIFNPFLENTYIVWDNETKEAAIIDPGCSDDIESSLLKRFIEKENLDVHHLINTHCHIDHVLGNAFVKEEYEATYFAAKEELFFLDTLQEYAQTFGIKATPSPNPDEFISDNYSIKIGNIEGIFLSTPGHSPGGYSLFFKNEMICFSGDTLFYESIGRTDLWEGNYDQLISSIKNKLFTLPDSTIIYPGHEIETSIGHEKKHNSFLL